MDAASYRALVDVSKRALTGGEAQIPISIFDSVRGASNDGHRASALSLSLARAILDLFVESKPRIEQEVQFRVVDVESKLLAAESLLIETAETDSMSEAKRMRVEILSEAVIGEISALVVSLAQRVPSEGGRALSNLQSVLKLLGELGPMSGDGREKLPGLMGLSRG